MDLSGIPEFINAAKSAVDLLKSAYELVPKGPKREELERKVKMAEDILTRSDAKLAKDLGYHLCKCSFPPHPMLWRENEHSYVCQDPNCGHRIKIARPEDFNDTPVRTDYF